MLKHLSVVANQRKGRNVKVRVPFTSAIGGT